MSRFKRSDKHTWHDGKKIPKIPWDPKLKKYLRKIPPLVVTPGDSHYGYLGKPEYKIVFKKPLCICIKWHVPNHGLPGRVLFYVNNSLINLRRNTILDLRSQLSRSMKKFFKVVMLNNPNYFIQLQVPEIIEKVLHVMEVDFPRLERTKDFSYESTCSRLKCIQPKIDVIEEFAEYFGEYYWLNRYFVKKIFPKRGHLEASKATKFYRDLMSNGSDVLGSHYKLREYCLNENAVDKYENVVDICGEYSTDCGDSGFEYDEESESGAIHSPIRKSKEPSGFYIMSKHLYEAYN